MYENIIGNISSKYQTSENDDRKLRDMSDASLSLAKLYERFASGDSTDDDVVEIQRSIAYDDSLKNEEPQAFKIAERNPTAAKNRAAYHRQRSLDLERLRRAHVEWNNTLLGIRNDR